MEWSSGKRTTLGCDRAAMSRASNVRTRSKPLRTKSVDLLANARSAPAGMRLVFSELSGSPVIPLHTPVENSDQFFFRLFDLLLDSCGHLGKKVTALGFGLLDLYHQFVDRGLPNLTNVLLDCV